MKLKQIITALFLAVGGSAAMADGMPKSAHHPVIHPVVEALPLETGPNWSGIYVGAGIGVDYSRVQHTYFDNMKYPSHQSDSAKDFLGYVSAGFDRQVHPGFVVGVFGDVDFGRAEMSGKTIDAINGAGLHRPYDMKLSPSWDVGLRAGFVHAHKTLFFIDGGYSEAKLKYEIDGYNKLDQKLSGWFVGAGFEHSLHHNWFIKGEYRYTDYRNAHQTIASACGGCNCGTCDQVDRFKSDVQSMRLGVVYKFGDRHDVVHQPLK
jgi:outer membrane immunogenic protein